MKWNAHGCVKGNEEQRVKGEARLSVPCFLSSVRLWFVRWFVGRFPYPYLSQLGAIHHAGSAARARFRDRIEDMEEATLGYGNTTRGPAPINHQDKFNYPAVCDKARDVACAVVTVVSTEAPTTTTLTPRPSLLLTLFFAVLCSAPLTIYYSMFQKSLPSDVEIPVSEASE